MSKTTKVMDYNEFGTRLVVIRHNDEKVNPYWVYRLKWDCGVWKRKLLVKYAEPISAMLYCVDYVRKGG